MIDHGGCVSAVHRGIDPQSGASRDLHDRQHSNTSTRLDFMSPTSNIISYFHSHDRGRSIGRRQGPGKYTGKQGGSGRQFRETSKARLRQVRAREGETGLRKKRRKTKMNIFTHLCSSLVRFSPFFYSRSVACLSRTPHPLILSPRKG